MNDETSGAREGTRRASVRAVTLALVLFGGSLAGAEEADRAPSRTRTLAAGPRYEAGWLHRFLLGSGYRDLWALPVEVEILDLDAWSGGLVAEEKGGGKQTRSLDFEGGDGREWEFRSIDKDPTAAVPPSLRETFAVWIFQDLTSASLPGGGVVVDALAAAAGIPHVKHRIVVLPDDPRLGAFRDEFAGMLGALAEEVSVKPPVTPGFEGYTRIVDTDELDALLDADPDVRVDSRAFLRARLLDLLVGDSDRHRGQWDWARDAETGRFVAVPKDRDLAFVKFDGLLPRLARQDVLHVVDFEADYPPIVHLAWQARRVDRRYLADLEWPAWKETAEELQARLTDAVIDEASRRLPPPYSRADGKTLAARLEARRDALPAAARRLYELLAREAEVHGTDVSDSAQVLRQGDGAVEVVLSGTKGPYFRRRFLPTETEEVRIFLKGGDDRALSEGRGSPRVRVRLVGGDGHDVLDDGAGHTRFYDSNGDNQVVEGPGTQITLRPYTPPTDEDGNPERDWGSQSRFLPWLRGSEDYGLVLGAGFERTGFGFRKHPYAERHTVRAGYSTNLRTGGVEYEYDSLRTDDRRRFHVTAQASALDLIHYFGFGNETTDEGPQSVYDVRLTQYALAPSYRLDVSGIDVSVGPVLKYADTDVSSTTLLARERPYGAGRFGQVGARAGMTFDRRGRVAGRSTGGLLSVEGTVYPGLWSVSDTFVRVEGEGMAFVAVGLPLEPTFALRAGGAKLFGRYPFHEAATLGGSASIRGLLRQRYAGDASIFGNAELRLLLVRQNLGLVPRFGVFGLGDVGRVFLEGEPSDRWHTAVGGGIWLSVADPRNVVSLALAHGEGRLRFHLQGGFSF